MGKTREYFVIVVQVICNDGEQFIGYLVNMEKKLYTTDISLAQLHPCENCVNEKVNALEAALDEDESVFSYYVTYMDVNSEDLKLAYNASI